MDRKSNAWLCIPILLASILVANGAVAQTPTGTVEGTVMDSNGAVVLGGEVTVRDLHTNSLRTASTQGNGHFEVPLLPSGSYELTVAKEGFRSYVVSPLNLDVDQTLNFPITLSVGAVAEAVIVSAETPLLETETSSLGQVLDNQKIVDLPLQNRNILELDLLVPGVHDYGATAAPATSGGVAFGQFNANGAPTNSNEFMLDGGTAVVANLNSASVIPTIDALQQSKILTSNIPAEFGRTGSIVFNAIYKTGTNRLHGTVYEFLRNKFLNANLWVNDANHVKKPFSNINTFGFSLGGPVWIPHVIDGRNRLFFFANYEGYRDVTPVSQLLTVPTVAEKGGDFTNLRDANGNLITIYDPLTVQSNGGRTQFSYNRVANVIPPSRFNATGVKLISYYPDPNTTPTNLNSNSSNYLTNASAYNTQNEWSIKLDYSPNEKNKFFARYTQSLQGGGNANLFGSTPSCDSCAIHSNPAGSYSPRGGGSALFVIPKNIVVGYTRVISPSTLLDVRAVFNRQLITRIPQTAGFDLTALGMPASLASAVYYKQFPGITVTNFQGLGTGSAGGDLLVRGDNTIATDASLTLLRGSHTMKLGGDFRMFRYNESGGVANVTPGFTFAQNWTQQNANITNSLQGSGLASLLLGIPSSGSYNIPAAVALQWFYGAVYMQDDWKVNPRLTLNLGIRYDLETPYTDRFNRATYFDPTATNAATAVDPAAIGGLRFVGKDIVSRRRNTGDYNNVGPRVGMAYKLTDNIVFRAAYGILYQPIFTYGFGSSVFGTQGYSQTTSMVVADGLGVANYIDNPFPGGLTQPTGNTLGTSTFLGQSVSTVLRYGTQTPYNQQFSAGFEQQLGSTLIGLGYVGTHAVHQFTNVSLNQLTPANFGLGSALAALVPNPFYGVITSGSLSSKTVSRGQLLRPFPEFTDVIDNNVSAGGITYSSLQAKVEHRYSKGLSVLVAYTWGKNMGNVGNRYPGGIAYQNAYNLAAEQSYSPLDIAHTVAASFSYMLPVGRGQSLGGDMPTWANYLAGGWQVNGLVYVSGGQPLLITATPNQLGYGNQAARPNRNYAVSLKLPNRTPGKFFNTAAYSAAPQYTFGNSKPYDGQLRGPGTDKVSLSVFKDIPVADLLKLQFRAEFFNAFNHPLWAAPGTTFGAPTFGVTPNKTNNRTGQLSLKLIF
jgi:hypothetical protein